MKNVAGWVLSGALLLLMGNVRAVPFQGAAKTTAASPKAGSAGVKEPAASSGYDDLLNDIDKEENAERRLQRYWDLNNNAKAPAATKKTASEKWQDLFQKKTAAEAATARANLYIS